MKIGTIKLGKTGYPMNLCLNYFRDGYYKLFFIHTYRSFKQMFFKEFPFWKINDRNVWGGYEKHFYVILPERLMREYVDMLKNYKPSNFQISISVSFDLAVETMVEKKI